MKRLHIHARDIARHDAVGNFAVQLGRLMSASGWDVRYWANHSDPIAGLSIFPQQDLIQSVEAGDVIFQNFSIYDPILERLAALPNRKILYYHNITPPELIDPEDSATVENCRLGRDQRAIARRFDVLLANSQASARDLTEGWNIDPSLEPKYGIAVCPPIINVDRWDKISDTIAEREGGTRLLFVGRLVRHKGVAQLLDVFEALSHRIGGLHLDIVGNPSGGAYVESLFRRAAEIEAATGSSIAIRHGIADEDLKGLYRSASACITLSKHEGFCVPATDALYFAKPFLFAPCEAVSEYVGGAGMVLTDSSPAEVADAVAALLLDAGRLADMGATTARQLSQLRQLANGDILRDAVQRAAAN